jgi:hypothetical protein
VTAIVSNVDLATALSKLSPEDRQYVDRLATDLRPTRRRRRRKTAAPAAEPEPAKARKKSTKKKTAASCGNGKAPETLIAKKKARAAALAGS